jgi:hypothetical protein
MTNSISGYRGPPAPVTQTPGYRGAPQLAPGNTAKSNEVESPPQETPAPTLSDTDKTVNRKVLEQLLTEVEKNSTEQIRDKVGSHPTVKHLYESGSPVSPGLVSLIKRITNAEMYDRAVGLAAQYSAPELRAVLNGILDTFERKLNPHEDIDFDNYPRDKWTRSEFNQKILEPYKTQLNEASQELVANIEKTMGPDIAVKVLNSRASNTFAAWNDETRKYDGPRSFLPPVPWQVQGYISARVKEVRELVEGEINAT